MHARLDPSNQDIVAPTPQKLVRITNHGPAPVRVSSRAGDSAPAITIQPGNGVLYYTRDNVGTWAQTVGSPDVAVIEFDEED